MAISDTSNQLRYAGDVNIDKVRLITSRGMTQDVTTQVIGIDYFEDLFAPFITGRVIIRDSLALTNVMKFVGEEYVELEFSTPTLGKPIKGTFYIHKMADRVQTGDRSVAYALDFISVEAVVDINKKISKQFSGKVSDVVRNLLTSKDYGLETTKQVNIEPTITSTTFISNYWSPLKNLNWCAAQAKNAGGVPNYILYENNNGFNFMSLDTLYTNVIYQDFIQDKYTRDEIGDGRTAANPEQDYKRILDITMPETYGDTLDQLRNGAIASRAITFDITKKTYTAKNYNYYDKFDKQKHLNEFPIKSGNLIVRPSSAMVFRPKMESNFSGTTDNTNFTYIQERLSVLRQANAHKVEITVPGRTDYCVGQKVSLELTKQMPLRETDDTSDSVDRIFSGNYLIGAINHSVTRQKHECHIELIKDSQAVNPNRTGEN